MTQGTINIAIVGAGAAGCFCAAQILRLHPEADICIFEGADRPMKKLAMTGGGRCNLSNTFASVGSLSEAYPRGDKFLRKVFSTFGPEQTWQWFEDAGVPVFAQDDGRIFPASQDAMEVVRCLRRMCSKAKFKCSCRIAKIEKESDYYILTSTEGEIFRAGKVVVTTGGAPREKDISFLSPLGLEMVAPVPSLFTFSIADKSLAALQGCSVPSAVCSLSGTRHSSRGAVLITDWGLSGPAILRLSSHAARTLAEKDYKAGLCINWTGQSREECAEALASMQKAHPQKMIESQSPEFGGERLPSRLWEHLAGKSLPRPGITWGQAGSKTMARLLENIFACEMQIQGKSRFKEEFVTCGGVALSEIDPKSMESRKHKGLHLCGEVLDIDAVTGGFNLQAAWSAAAVAAAAIAGSIYSA